MVKVWTDGCYDMVHFGHANQIRQAKMFGDYLIVGVHSDADITQHKGPPVFCETERYRMVRAIRWVDEVIEGSTYFPSAETLDTYGCDFCVHGDDISLAADGTDTYGLLKAAGRYRECKRTAGVSTTDLSLDKVGRMLLMTRPNIVVSDPNAVIPVELSSPWTNVVASSPIDNYIQLFSEGRKPKATDRIVYCPGAFDLFHIGHLAFLEEAAKHGDYLIAVCSSPCLHDDRTLARVKGMHHPVQAVHERMLTCLAFRVVGEVIPNVAYTVDEELLSRYRVDVVCVGVERDNGDIPPDPMTGEADSVYKHPGADPYVLPKRMGKFIQVNSASDMTTTGIVDRIIENRRAFESRNRAKQAKEMAAYEELQRRGQSEGNNGSTYHSVNIKLDATMSNNSK